MLIPDAVLDLISTIIQRNDVIRCLLADPKDTRTLVDELDTSRSTVNRSVRDLEQFELVEYRDGQYHVTLSGRLAFQEFRSYVQCLEDILAVQDLLNRLDEDCPLDARAVMGAEVVSGEPAASHFPGERVEQLIREADRCRALAYAHSYPGSVDIVHEQLLRGELKIDVLLRPVLWEHMQSCCSDTLDEWRDTGRFRAFTVDNLPFGLQILERNDETRVCVLVYDVEDQLQGLILNDSEFAIEWAESIYQQYRRLATPVVEPSDEVAITLEEGDKLQSILGDK